MDRVSVFSMVERDASQAGPKAESAMQVDFGIITIRDDEFRAALDFFKPSLPSYSGHREYSIGEVQTLTGASYRVAIVRAVEP